MKFADANAVPVISKRRQITPRRPLSLRAQLKLNRPPLEAGAFSIGVGCGALAGPSSYSLYLLLS